MQPTSLEMYEEVKKTLGKRQLRVFIEISFVHNLTNSELAHRLGWSINTVTPRVFELRQLGLVKEDYKRLCSITGRRAIAWRMKRPEEPKEQQMRLNYGRI